MGPTGKNGSETQQISDGCVPLSWCMDSLDKGPSSQPDITEGKMFVFLSITVQMEHCLWNHLTDYWAKIDQFYTSFYRNMMKQNGY
jgi:hypothetical protein